MSYKEVNMYYHWTFLDGLKGFYQGYNEEEMTFKFGGIVWSIIKDDLDGERSLIDYIVYGDQKKSFEEKINERVKVVEIIESPVSEHEIFSGWKLESIDDGHIYLIIGTDYSSDSYPKVIFKHFNRIN